MEDIKKRYNELCQIIVDGQQKYKAMFSRISGNIKKTSYTANEVLELLTELKGSYPNTTS